MTFRRIEGNWNAVNMSLFVIRNGLYLTTNLILQLHEKLEGIVRGEDGFSKQG